MMKRHLFIDIFPQAVSHVLRSLHGLKVRTEARKIAFNPNVLQWQG